MIRALPSSILSACPDVLYVVTGHGAERAYLEGLVRECGVATAVQFRENLSEEDLVAHYQQCDLFALPNRQVGWDIEGFGTLLIEAQACDKPVVAGLSGGAVDTLRRDVTGELVDATSPEALADTIVRMPTNTERSRIMGEQARTWAVQNYDWGQLARHAARVFEGSRAAAREVVAL